MPVLTNPYIAGNPVGNSAAFVGREDVLREVLRMLRSTSQNAITLFGQRRIGKTSVLQWLDSRLPDEGPFQPIYLDLQDKAAWPLGRVLGDLARAIAGRLVLPAPDLGSDAEAGFRQNWLPQALQSLPVETRLVLLFDEFDVLADPKTQKAASSFFPYLRELLALDPERLKFIFVLGRNVTDLSSIAMSLFKGTPSMRVSLLAEKDAHGLIRLSEKKPSLEWSDDAVERAWSLAHGHPYLTQALCSQVWELAYEAHDQPPPVRAEDVEAAAPHALEASRNTLEWLWGGLGPAERVVIAALAQAGDRAVDENELEQILRNSGVRILIRELQNAPKILQDWDLIEPVEGGYRFRVELLRSWIAEYRPLNRVHEELDLIQPLAESLYQAAQGYYRSNNLVDAESQLRQALNANPNHMRATDLLAEILITRGELADARVLLEKYYDFAPQNARPRLVQVYLAQARANPDQMEQLALYEKTLEIEPGAAEAISGRQRILESRGLSQIEDLQTKKRFAEALEVAQQIQRVVPDDPTWLGRVELLKKQVDLADLYQRALVALEDQDYETAVKLLVDVISREPSYEQATYYLDLAVKAKALQPSIGEPSGTKVGRQTMNRQDAAGQSEVLDEPGIRWGRIKPFLSALAVLILVLIVLVGGLWVYSVTRRPAATAAPTPTATQPITHTATPPITGSSWTRPADGMTMRLVPAGEFNMGSESGESGEKPVHTVFTDAFWMDEHEVTNAMYALCVEAGACSKPGGSNFEDPQFTNHPVDYVSWDDADKYCKWAGARLPTEAEWEKAGRGGLGGMTYPWGNDTPVCTPGAINGAQSDVCDGDTVPVKSFGPNGYGLHDMAGNVWEWVADWYDDGYYASLTSGVSNPSGPATGTYRVLRGGSWSDDEFGGRVALRNWLDPRDTSYYVTGFRCSRSPFKEEQPVTTQPAPLLGSSWTRPADGMTMQLVPAGEFDMGSDNRSTNEQPVHTVALDAFLIDEHEVTYDMYARCIAADGCTEPSDGPFGEAEFADHPVVYVSWEQAGQYCAWAGAHLPTEAQWEKAARGGLEGMAFPWGDDPPTCIPGAQNGAQFDACDGGALPVKRFAPNGNGLYDMAGNVSEWTADWFSEEYYANSPASNPDGPATGTDRVFRGGSVYSGDTDLGVAVRYWDTPDITANDLGFRCARSISRDDQPAETQPETTQPAPDPLTDSFWIRPADEMTMHLVPAGEFNMGSESGEANEQPVHSVFIDAFYMDEHEVTNAMYALCVEAGACETPSEGPFSEAEFTDHPVIYITWQKANNYCEWAGARLPTEAEWEKAARGGLEGMTYPWGDETPTCTAGAENGAQSEACDGDTVPVKSFSRNGYWLYDMAGNVWEMVADWYDEQYYPNSPASNPSGPESGTQRILRGGSWDTTIRDVSVYHRGTMDAEDAYFSFGFRCALIP